MQRWEYMTIGRGRSFKKNSKFFDGACMVADDWNIDLQKKLEEAGNEGWELVSVIARSDILGGTKLENTERWTSDYAGFTSHELWVFKRPLAK